MKFLLRTVCILFLYLQFSVSIESILICYNALVKYVGQRNIVSHRDNINSNMCERRKKTKKTLILSNSLKQFECVKHPSDSFKREISAYLLKWNGMGWEVKRFLFFLFLPFYISFLPFTLLSCTYTHARITLYFHGKTLTCVSLRKIYVQCVQCIIFEIDRKKAKKKKKNEMVWFYV